MRSGMLLIVGTAATALLGCDGRTIEVSETRNNGQGQVQVAARLDCPQREGDLRLVSAAGDGRACAYRDENGAEVELRLTGADGRAELAALETELRTLVPDAASPPEPPEPPLPLEAPGGRQADGTGEDKARVRVPGVMDIRTEGDRASVRLPGMRVEANGDEADVKIGDDLSVRAHEGGAEIRAQDDDKGALTSTFILASEEPGPAGWRVAGYQARGQTSGPLVLGVIRARRERHERLMENVEDLLDRNVRN